MKKNDQIEQLQKEKQAQQQIIDEQNNPIETLPPQETQGINPIQQNNNPIQQQAPTPKEIPAPQPQDSGNNAPTEYKSALKKLNHILELCICLNNAFMIN